MTRRPSALAWLTVSAVTCADLEAFLVHRVILDAVALHRLKRSRPDVQRHLRERHALCAKPVEQLIREVQSRRRRGDRAVGFCVHRLVTIAIGAGVDRRALDVRRQRRLADGLQEFVHVRCPREAKQIFAGVVLVDRLDPVRSGAAVEVVQLDACPVVNAFAGTQHAPPFAGRAFLGEQDFHPRAVAFLLAAHARRDDTRVVRHQNVARAEQCFQVGKLPVRDGCGGAIQRKQSRGVPLLDGMLGNKFLRQGVVEIGRSHGGISSWFRGRVRFFDWRRGGVSGW